MAAHTPVDSSRKPSGSSSHSAGQSPSGSPSNAHSQRKLANNANGAFGAGPGGIKGLNAGWQVWGASAPASKRNASVSSATSATEGTPAENTYRGNMAEGWNSSRPPSGTWDDANGTTQKVDFSQLRQSNAAPPATLSVPRGDGNGLKPGQYSPQRYDNNLGKEGAPRYPSSASPTKTGGFAAFPQVQPSLSASNALENDLVLGMRGMAVEDDYSASNQMPRPQQRAYSTSSSAGYNGYPQTDYSGYYGNGSANAVDYPYGYPTADPGMYSTNPGAAMGASSQQPSPYYDYQQAQRPPGSQFYYPTQLMYPPSPMMPQQVTNPGVPVSAGVLASQGTGGPATLAERKLELQYALSHNIGRYGMRSTPSPHPQYGNGIDYNAQIMLQNGTMYGHSGQPMQHGYQTSARAVSRRTDGTEASAALRSPLLDEFRGNKARKWELRDIFHYIVEFSGDQHGSRFIQQKLETATTEEKQVVFDEIVPDNALQLIQDVFGNYVIQKLFEHGTQVQKTLLASTMEGHVLTLSLQMYGCRVVQKAVEYVLPDQQGAFVKELDTHVLKCVKDANGNHVIQKLIERVSADRLAFVHSFRGNVYELATHPYGCRVLQRCFEHLPEEHTRPLLEELHKYIINLMQDQFGNYVVQFVLEHGQPQDRALVIAKLRGQMLQMARHKFASNVCEKALVASDLESRRVLIDEIMTPKQDGVSPIVTMMKDQFANYVLQRALAVAEGEQREELVSKVRPQLVSMRRYSSAYSKHLISIERLLEKNGMASKDVGQDFRVTPNIQVSN